ncbi:protein toll-like [Ochlerotatus camptorhynchus]|uniref:protein toll-like n=1 Tax=Ochlerotatus camptorhynchus TaxID=644619 RepID=UPI0031DB71DB
MKITTVLWYIALVFESKSVNASVQNHDYVIGTELLNQQTGQIPHNERGFVCPEPNPAIDCSCMYAITDYEIQCPVVNPEITVKIKPQAYAQVQCYDRHDLHALPALKSGNTTQVKVIHCPLPEDKSIMQLVSFLGVENVKDFWYQNYGRSLGMRIMRPHFEGMQGLEKLYLSAGVDYIQPDLFADLTNLKWLILRGNNLKRLASVFDNLTELVILELGANQITELEAGLFCKQGKLRHLNLWHNELRTVTKETLRGVELLEELDLSVNLLESIEVDVFAQLMELSALNIGFNQLRSIPAGLLAENHKLKEFKFINNRVPIDVLPGDLFSNHPELKTVIVSRSGLSQVPGSLFYGSTGIKQIDLSYNRLGLLPGKLLRDQHWLQEVNLSFNELEVIPEELFENTAELVSLDLSFNRLRNLSARVFASLDKLTELHLEHNLLQAIDLFTFTGTGSLEKLYMQNNHLDYHGSNDKSPFQYMNNLRILNLKNNSISTILHDWNYNTLQLRELDLSYNNIVQLSYLNLHFISRDIRIDLSHNQISRIDMKEYRIPALKRPGKSGKIQVNINANPLDCNCHILSFVQYLQSDKVSTRRIQFSSDDLHCIQPVHLLGTQANHLSTRELVCQLNQPICPANCSCFQRPIDYGVIVNCSGLELMQVPSLPQPDTFGYGFIELHVQDNLLSDLPTENLEGFTAVAELYARNNFIKSLQPENLPGNLRVLDLSMNKLMSLDFRTIHALNGSHQLEGLQLGGNPWQCDCDSSQFLNFVQQSFQLITDINQITCDSGERLVAISVSDLCKERWIMIIAICLSILMLGLLVGILTSLCFAYHNEIKIWLFNRNLLMCCVSEHELDKDKQFDAFISYSHKDEDFVANTLVPTLEQPPMNFRTCWHVRDWMPGELIAEQMTNSISESRRTIVVLSKSFLESVWARMEFRTAHLNSIAERRTRVIVILYEHVGDIEQFDADLRAYLRMNTYIRWGDPWFWDRLRYAMPHSPKALEGVRPTRSYDIGAIEDRLELSKPQMIAMEEYRGYVNPTFSRSLGMAMDELGGNVNFGLIERIDSRCLDELFIVITKESEV